MEKNIHSHYRKKLQNKSLRWFHFLSISHFVCNPSCYFVICKTRKTNSFLREHCELTFPPPSPVRGPSGEGGQKAAGRICSRLLESSRVADKHRSKHWIKCGNIQTKIGLFSFTPLAPWDEYSRTTHILVAKPPHLRTWLVSDHPKLVLYDERYHQYCHKNTKVHILYYGLYQNSSPKEPYEIKYPVRTDIPVYASSYLLKNAGPIL